MSNKGVQPGVVKDGWHSFVPTLVGLVHASGATPTQPTLGNSTIFARYTKSPLGLVTYYGSIVFGSTATFGSGEDMWAISLPAPLYSWTGASVNPIGNVMLWQGSAASPTYTLPAMATRITDPNLSPFAQQDQNDFYFAISGIQPKGQGTGTITNATPATITHGLGQTPLAYDITITPTSLTAGSANPGCIYIDTITATQFNVNTSTALGASKSLGFSWKADALPAGNNGAGTEYYTANVNSLRPFAWAANNSISWHMTYEARS